MDLVIISNMAHYNKDGRILGWGPTVEEIDYLAKKYNKVLHICCLHKGGAPNSSRPYKSENVEFKFLPPSGGNSI